MAVANAYGLQEPCTIYTNNVIECRLGNCGCLVVGVPHLHGWVLY